MLRYAPAAMHQLLNFLLPVLQDPPPPAKDDGGGGMNLLFPMLLVGAIFWFVLIGPERKQRKRRQAMISALQKGDKVMTNGGMFGVVAQVQGDVITLQVADGVRMRFTRQAVQSLVEDDKEKEQGKGKGKDKEEKDATKS